MNSLNLDLGSPTQPIEEPDLSITINCLKDSSGDYFYQYFFKPRKGIKCGLNNLFGRSKSFSRESRNYLKQQFDDINQVFRGKNYNKKRLDTKIRNFGKELYEELAGDLDGIYWNLIYKNIQTIELITAKDSFFPWEILVPFNSISGKNEELKFLCEIHDITRWFGDGLDDCETIRIQSVGIVCISDSNLSASDAEAKSIRHLFSSSIRCEVLDIVPSSVEIIQALSNQSSISGIHFIGHNMKSEHSALAYLELERGDVLEQKDLSYRNCKKGLFIFLNACETGLLEVGFTEPQGWAKKFIKDLKGSAFIGSIWEVPDHSAKDFAIALYENLLNKMTISQAVRNARCSPKNDSASIPKLCDETQGNEEIVDPAVYSYVVYAYPCAKFLFEELKSTEAK